jgi:hypothetical protein
VASQSASVGVGPASLAGGGGLTEPAIPQGPTTVSLAEVSALEKIDELVLDAMHKQGVHTVPALLVVSLSTPIGPMLRVRLTYGTAGAAQTGANTIALGVDLIGRTR